MAGISNWSSDQVYDQGQIVVGPDAALYRSLISNNWAQNPTINHTAWLEVGSENVVQQDLLEKSSLPMSYLDSRYYMFPWTLQTQVNAFNGAGPYYGNSYGDTTIYVPGTTPPAGLIYSWTGGPYTVPSGQYNGFLFSLLSPTFSQGTAATANQGAVVLVANAAGTEKLFLSIAGHVDIASGAWTGWALNSAIVLESVGTDLHVNSDTTYPSIDSTAGGQYFVTHQVQLITADMLP